MGKSLKLIIWIILFVLAFLLSFILFKGETWKDNLQIICCNNECFNIEIADTPKMRQIWLMYRNSLWSDEWMLFIFDEPWLHSFWMKNTLIPLAWIRLDSDFKIVDVIQMDPCTTEQCQSYKPQSEAKYVLEINQWLISEKWLIHVWDFCELM